MSESSLPELAEFHEDKSNGRLDKHSNLREGYLKVDSLVDEKECLHDGESVRFPGCPLKNSIEK